MCPETTTDDSLMTPQPAENKRVCRRPRIVLIDEVFVSPVVAC